MAKKRNLTCPSGEKFKQTYFSFDFLLQHMNQSDFSQKKIVILHESENFNYLLKKFLISKMRPPITLLTTMNPFPYSKINTFLHNKNDHLIISFSNSDQSKKALRKSFCNAKMIKHSTL